MASSLYILLLATIFLSCAHAKAIHKCKDSHDGHKSKHFLRHSPTIAFIPKEAIAGAVEDDKLQSVVPVPTMTRIHTPVLHKIQEKLDTVHSHMEMKRERLEVLRQHLVDQTEQFINHTGNFIKSTFSHHRGQLAFVPKNWESASNSSDPNDPLSAAPDGYVPVIIYGLPHVTPTDGRKPVPVTDQTPTTESPSTTIAVETTPN